MIERAAEETVKEISQTFRVLLVTGPRQVGKTTLLKANMPEGMNYVTLDDLVLRQAAKTDPKLFLEEHPFPLMIDEAQYAPELFPYLKIMVDEVGQPGMYWLTGSQQFSLMKQVTESLAGRVGIVQLNSLSYAEIQGSSSFAPFNPAQILQKPKISTQELFEIIFRGGMPELYATANIRRENFFQSYIDTYLARDVKDQLDIKDIPLFRRFLVAVATKNGEQLNYSAISNEIGVSDKTVRSWLDVLLTSGIIYFLEPYMNTKLKRITHMPKIVFMDSGLCSYLAGWESARDLQLSTASGHYLESFIVSEILKAYHATGVEPNISYYRDKEKREIDLIFNKNGKLYPFEIKKTASPDLSMAKNFSLLGDDVETGGIICLYDNMMRLSEQVSVVPISSVIA